jgi:triacylglycerol esterase/lipase EstA (alpha/beta hydrolase family)
VHGGLMEIARAIYNDVKQFIDFTAPQHKLVLTGHSVGGSLSIMLLFLMVQDKGGMCENDSIGFLFMLCLQN